MTRALQPRWVMLTYWTIVVAATLVLYPTSTFNWGAGWLIVLYVSFFTFGVIITTLKKRDAPEREIVEPVKLRGGVIKIAAIVGAGANILAAIMALHSTGRSIGDVLSLSGLLQVGNASAVARYALGESDPTAALLVGIGYVAAMVAPFIRLTNTKHRVWVLLVPPLTSLLYSSVTTARLSFLISVAFTVGGVIATFILQTGNAPAVKFKVVFIGAISAALVFGIFIGIAQVRVGSISQQAVGASLDKQIVYSLGGLGAFSTWLDRYQIAGDTQLGLGTASIAGMEYLTGQDRLATRSYDEYVQIDLDGRSSNIYTMFRGWILDFGVAGTAIVMVILGGLLGIAQRRAAQGSLIGAAFIAFSYASIGMSPWLAVSSFSNVLIVLLVAPIIFAFAKYRKPPVTVTRPDVGTVAYRYKQSHR